MRLAPLLLAAVALTGVFLVTRKVQAAETAATLDPLFQKWGDVYGVDPLLLKAHATVESGLDPTQINPADPSFGLMQVLCRHGADGVCTNKFYVDGWTGMTTEKLLNPDTNIQIAAQIVAANVRAYGMPKAIAVYNSWTERNSPPGGPFGNQDYVDKVLAEYQNLQGG